MRFQIASFLIACGLIGALSSMSGCNTVAGAGTDIKKGGEAVHDEAKEVQRKM